MPELPEVETTVLDLKKKVLKRTFIDVWTDFPKMIKRPSFDDFRKEIKGRKIEKIWRRGKNIIFELDGKYYLLIHQKLTGHLLFGKWELKNKEWKAKISGPLSEDPMNKFLHLIFFLDDGRQLALSDLRKFAKVELLKKEDLEEELKEIGPEPLEKNFTFEKFKEILSKNRGKIKEVLMDQKVIAGIGNIYSDEILWQAEVQPQRQTKSLKEEEIKKIYKAMREVLLKAIKLGGESISDFRRPSGEKGFFDRERKVYRREGEKCFRCRGIIKRVKIGGRSAHFCPSCQI